MVEAPDGQSWIYKNKDHGNEYFLVADARRELTLCLLIGMMSATASIGLSLLWDTDEGLSHVDRFTYASEEYIKVRNARRVPCVSC